VIILELPAPDPAGTLVRSAREMHEAAAVISAQAATIRRLRWQRGALLLLAAYLCVLAVK
jgi:hypothetical protein